MRILFLSRWFPFPADNGSKLRVFNLLDSLTKEHDVSLLSFGAANSQEKIDSIPHGLDIVVVPWKGFAPGSARAQLGFLSKTPRSIIDSYSTGMACSIEKTLRNRVYDIIIASQIDTAAYSRHFQGYKAIFEEAEVGIIYDRYAKARSEKGKLRSWLTWEKYRKYLSRLLKDYRSCTVVSNRERDLLVDSQVIRPEKLEVIPNCVNLGDYKFGNTPKPGALIFIGSLTYFPNYEAIKWFIEDVYPIVQRQFPTVELTITGDHADLPLPPANNIIRTGYVHDLRPYLANSAASIVPIFQGGGTRIKILEAMATGTPVISTTKGAEGLDIEAGVHFLLADTPAEFASCVLTLLTDRELRESLSSNAYELIKNKYDWSIVKPRYLSLVENVARS